MKHGRIVGAVAGAMALTAGIEGCAMESPEPEGETSQAIGEGWGTDAATSTSSSSSGSGTGYGYGSTSTTSSSSCSLKSAKWQDGESPTTECAAEKTQGACNGFGSLNAIALCECQGTCKEASVKKKYEFGCSWKDNACKPNASSESSVDDVCKGACVAR
ncbi:MAG: hypothetical protein JST00_34005 [Deltaproteobacteria bacterium]|nr:hypothetical protein [Deltaproteobacteria bacterium]